MIIMRDSSATKKHVSDHFTLISLKLLFKNFRRELLRIKYVYMQRQPSGGVLWKKYSKKILQNSQKSICAEVSFLIKLQTSSLKLYWKRIPAQLFSWHFWEIFNNNFFIVLVWLLNVMVLLIFFYCFSWNF